MNIERLCYKSTHLDQLTIRIVLLQELKMHGPLRIAISIAFFFTTVSSFGAPQTPTAKTHELFESLDYPELQVVPLASRRLKIEATDEDKNWWYVHWPIQVSALSTMVLPIVLESHKKDDLDAAQASDFSTGKTGSYLLGAGWLTATILLGMQKPYKKAYKEARSVKGKDKRSRLLRERNAEEALEKQARLMKKLKWAAAISNAVAAINLNTYIKSTGNIYGITGVLVALLPLWFEDRHVYTHRKHMEYKQNIYTPVTRLNYRPEQTVAGTRLYPQVELNWVF